MTKTTGFHRMATAEKWTPSDEEVAKDTVCYRSVEIKPYLQDNERKGTNQ